MEVELAPKKADGGIGDATVRVTLLRVVDRAAEGLMGEGLASVSSGDGNRDMMERDDEPYTNDADCDKSAEVVVVALIRFVDAESKAETSKDTSTVSDVAQEEELDEAAAKGVGHVMTESLHTVAKVIEVVDVGCCEVVFPSALVEPMMMTDVDNGVVKVHAAESCVENPAPKMVTGAPPAASTCVGEKEETSHAVDLRITTCPKLRMEYAKNTRGICAEPIPTHITGSGLSKLSRPRCCSR